jgi:hypothetical protein
VSAGAILRQSAEAEHLIKSFLQSDKLTKAAVSVTGWEVPTP